MKKEMKNHNEEISTEMSAQEARAYRASLFKPKKAQLSEEQKKELFRIFWARERVSYNKPRDLEKILWTHLVSTKLNDPENFEKGLKNFGLKKVR
jgi:hypothetical protein